MSIQALFRHVSVIVNLSCKSELTTGIVPSWIETHTPGYPCIQLKRFHSLHLDVRHVFFPNPGELVFLVSQWSMFHHRNRETTWCGRY